MPLLITVELVPFGDHLNKEVIGQMYIINTGEGTNEQGDYDYVVKEANALGVLTIKDSGKINKFKRKKGFWSLIKIVLQNYSVFEI